MKWNMHCCMSHNILLLCSMLLQFSDFLGRLFGTQWTLCYFRFFHSYCLFNQDPWENFWKIIWVVLEHIEELGALLPDRKLPISLVFSQSTICLAAPACGIADEKYFRKKQSCLLTYTCKNRPRILMLGAASLLWLHGQLPVLMCSLDVKRGLVVTAD